MNTREYLGDNTHVAYDGSGNVTLTVIEPGFERPREKVVLDSFMVKVLKAFLAQLPE